MQNTFTGVFEKIEDSYICYIQELPSANVQEKTLEKARESLREAMKLILRSHRELAENQLRCDRYFNYFTVFHVLKHLF